MLEIKHILHQWQRKIVLVMLTGLIWLISLPTNSVEATGYYSVKDHKAELVRPYYATRERHIAGTEITRPYYTTKDRTRITTTGDNYIESGKRGTEVMPKEIGTGKRQKNSIKRTFRTNDYERSEIEK
ncbi:hypothetical protein [Anabaena sp. UHCC 0399]|uniref:hypothetical protein n=1 Tax=Anabaena sp. UHCC 0399 TaxID=3110238 RepID=UPI002B2216E1|nr:hypothetical protein [Anabaena sp. UHCC 0399]MEA5567194.1 hypothetical protein [Anabaena sp. UHCC 0399]